MLCSLFSQYMHAQWQAVIVRLGVLSDGNAVNANAGLAFLVFGLAQILFHSPLGMYLDTHSPPAQASWLLAMAVSTTILSLLSVAFSSSLPILLLLKFLQGAVTTILPPALNSMSLNVIGVENFSRQVSLNERGSHAGTCVYNLLGGLLACVLFPNHVGLLFLLSVGGCVGVAFAVEAFKKEYASPFTEDPTVPAPGYVDLNDFSVSDEAASRTTVKSMSAAFEEIMDTSSQRFRRFGKRARSGASMRAARAIRDPRTRREQGASESATSCSKRATSGSKRARSFSKRAIWCQSLSNSAFWRSSLANSALLC